MEKKKWQKGNWKREKAKRGHVDHQRPGRLKNVAKSKRQYRTHLANYRVTGGRNLESGHEIRRVALKYPNGSDEVDGWVNRTKVKERIFQIESRHRTALEVAEAKEFYYFLPTFFVIKLKTNRYKFLFRSSVKINELKLIH